jgi:hypothetical protein
MTAVKVRHGAQRIQRGTKAFLISHIVQLHHEDCRYEPTCGEEWAATVGK